MMEAGTERIICVIGARGGSQGVPGKNIREFCGKPLIAWSIANGLTAQGIGRVVVSTDSLEIAKVAREHGAEVPFMRPAELSGPHVGKFQVWQHALSACEALDNQKYDIYVDLDCTNPLLEASDITKALEQFRRRRTAGVPIDAIFTVSKSRRNPYFNLVEKDEDGALRMSKSRGGVTVSRQAAPVVYEHVAGVYVLATEYLRTRNHLLDGHAEGYEVPEEKAQDIDSEFDFALIEYLMRRRLKLAN